MLIHYFSIKSQLFLVFSVHLLVCFVLFCFFFLFWCFLLHLQLGGLKRYFPVKGTISAWKWRGCVVWVHFERQGGRMCSNPSGCPNITACTAWGNAVDTGLVFKTRVSIWDLLAKAGSWRCYDHSITLYAQKRLKIRLLVTDTAIGWLW